MVLGAFGLPILAAVVVFGLVNAMRVYFSGVHPRVWPVLLGLCAVTSLVGGVIAVRGPSARPTAYGLAAGLLVGATALALAARLAWRSAAPKRFVFTAGLRGELGLVVVGVIVVALVTRGTLGVVLGIVGGVAFLGLLILDLLREQSAFQHVRRRIEDAQPWPRPGKATGWDPYGDDRVTGTWGDCRVWIAMTTDGGLVKVQLEHWPAELAAERAGGKPAALTGDEAFDRSVRLDGADERWRPLLTDALRTQLRTLIETTGAVIARDGTISVEVHDPRELERTADALTRFARSVPPSATDPQERVFELAQAEPIAAVRRQHYRWLVEHRWNAPRVFRAAAADADPAIAAWGRDQLPPDAGVFR